MLFLFVTVCFKPLPPDTIQIFLANVLRSRRRFLTHGTDFLLPSLTVLYGKAVVFLARINNSSSGSALLHFLVMLRSLRVVQDEVSFCRDWSPWIGMRSLFSITGILFFRDPLIFCPRRISFTSSQSLNPPKTRPPPSGFATLYGANAFSNPGARVKIPPQIDQCTYAPSGTPRPLPNCEYSYDVFPPRGQGLLSDAFCIFFTYVVFHRKSAQLFQIVNNTWTECWRFGAPFP